MLASFTSQTKKYRQTFPPEENRHEQWLPANSSLQLTCTADKPVTTIGSPSVMHVLKRSK
jgi:hypothetical protein